MGKAKERSTMFVFMEQLLLDIYIYLFICLALKVMSLPECFDFTFTFNLANGIFAIILTLYKLTILIIRKFLIFGGVFDYEQ